jgi:hypothetical protein
VGDRVVIQSNGDRLGERGVAEAVDLHAGSLQVRVDDHHSKVRAHRGTWCPPEPRGLTRVSPGASARAVSEGGPTSTTHGRKHG